jgi:hypothetical protein
MNLSTRMAAAVAVAGLSLAAVMTTPAGAATPTAHPEPASVLTGEMSTAGWDRAIEIGPGRNSCPTYWVCVWTGTNFSGRGLAMNGNVVYGDWADWRGTIWENNVRSAVNKGTGPVDFQDLRDGRWRSLGRLNAGYDFKSGWPGALYADRIVYVG